MVSEVGQRRSVLLRVAGGGASFLGNWGFPLCRRASARAHTHTLTQGGST